MTSKKASEIFASAGFLLLLLLAAAATLACPKETFSYYENRDLAELPALTAESAVSGKWSGSVEDYLRDHAAERSELMRISTRFDMEVAKRPVVNETVVESDILLPWNDFETVNRDEIGAEAAVTAGNAAQVKELTESFGGHYIYAAVPNQLAYYGESYPWYLNSRKEYLSAALPAFFREMEKRGVSCIDMGKTFAALGWPNNLSSRVDNHYSIYGAYLTYREIMDGFNAESGADLTVLRDGDYEVIELANHYLGSRLRKLLDIWPSSERLSVLIPHTAVPFTRRDNGEAYPPVVYSMPTSGEGDVLYTLYMGGDVNETVIDTGRPELPRLLVYGDSFTNAAETMLYYGFGEMHSLDLRHYNDMSLGDYIREYRPDYVVCIRDYDALLMEDGNGAGAD